MAEQITKEQWAEILEGFIKLRIVTRVFMYQGFELKVEPHIYKEKHIHWTVRINGDLKEEWIDGNTDDMPIIESVWHKRTRAKYKPGNRKSLIKKVGVRRAKKMYPDLEEILVVYSPGFTSSRALCSQFKKLDGLELIETPIEEKANDK